MYCISLCQINQHSVETRHNRLVSLALLRLLYTRAALLRRSEWTRCQRHCTQWLFMCDMPILKLTSVSMQVQCKYRGSVPSPRTKCPTTSSKCTFRVSVCIVGMYVLFPLQAKGLDESVLLYYYTTELPFVLFPVFSLTSSFCTFCVTNQR